ncbi:hypothetical protein Tco_0540055 [Tanacetum coccineum]
MYISSQSSCDFTTVTIIGETEERRNYRRNYPELYDGEDGETTSRFESIVQSGRYRHLLVKYVKFWEDWEVDRYGNANLGMDKSNYKKIVKNGQARTRESEEFKKKPKIQSRSQKSQASVKSSQRCIPVILVVPAEVPIAPVDPLVAPEVGAVSVISPTRVLDLVDYSSSFNSDPSEDSLPVAPELLLVSPFLCSDDSEADSESEPAEQRPERHGSLTSSSEFPLAPVVAPPGIRRRPMILVRPGEAIPFGRPYRTHPNRPRKLLTARKRVGPFLAHRLAWKHVSHRSSDRHSSPYFTSDSSSSGLSLDSSSDISSGSSSDSYSDSSSVHSSGCDASGQSHSGPSTRVASPRLVDPPVRTPRCSHWIHLHLLLDHLARDADPLLLWYHHLLVSRSIAPALADLLPRKRFRDSYSSEVSREEHMEIGTVDVETVVDLGISDRVEAPTEDGIGMGVQVATSDIKEDEEEFEAEANAGGTMEIAVDPLVTGGSSDPTGGDAPDLEGTLYDIAYYMSEVSLDRITEFETAQRYLRRHMALSQEEFCQIRRDRDDTLRRLRRLDSLVERHFGFYQGVVGLIRWFEKMETVFHISTCPEKYQVKYATCTLLNSVLTWWNSHKRTIGTDAAFSMSWRELMKLMAEVYCPRTKIQKMESEL